MFRLIALSTLLAVACASLSFDSGSIGWRIVGGQKAEEGQFPHQISLRRFGSHSCGGSILDKTTVLTAAHCVDGAGASSLTVVTGTNKLNQGGDSYKVASILVHADWDSWSITNDVAIVKLSEPIQFSDKVKTIELEEKEIDGDEDCTLSGWGRTNYPGNIPNDLQFINLKTTTFEQCKKAHIGIEVVESEICTLTKSGEGACHGDSGGPLIRNGKQIGIVSWGQPCAKGYPDVFTRVSSFVRWIKVGMQQNE